MFRFLTSCTDGFFTSVRVNMVKLRLDILLPLKEVEGPLTLR